MDENIIPQHKGLVHYQPKEKPAPEPPKPTLFSCKECGIDEGLNALDESGICFGCRSGLAKVVEGLRQCAPVAKKKQKFAKLKEIRPEEIRLKDGKH